MYDVKFLDFWTIAPYIRHRAIKYNYSIRWRYRLQVSLWRDQGYFSCIPRIASKSKINHMRLWIHLFFCFLEALLLAPVIVRKLGGHG